MTTPLPRLKRRSEFLRVAGARCKAVTPGLILQAMQRSPAAPSKAATAAVASGTEATGRAARDGDPSEQAARIGFTASRKVGNAVVRNRARRRLRAVAAEVLPLHAAPGHDYVLIARGETVVRPYPLLVEDLKKALRRVSAFREASAEAAPVQPGL
jgi:ribonuclease P protein component